MNQPTDNDMQSNIQHNGPSIIVLCGLPGSGKSTLRDSFRGENMVHLSTDDYVEQIAAFRGKTYDQIWSDEIGNATVAVHNQFRQAIHDKRSIVWDQTNLTPKKRKKILSQVPGDYYKIAIFVQVPEELRQERLKNRPCKVIPAHVDRSMQDNLTIPTKEEGFDAVLLWHSTTELKNT